MKRIGVTALVSLIALCASVPAFAGTPAPSLFAALSSPASASSCLAPQDAFFLAATKPSPSLNKALCSATANCASGTVSCNGNNSSTSCSAYDRNCAAGEQGHVTCDGATTWCATACPPTSTCSTGTFRQRACCRCGETGDCWDCYFCEQGSPPPIDAC